MKSEIANLINGKIATSNVSAIVSDKEFMHKIMLEMAKEWVKKKALTITTKGVKIEQVNGKPASFTILPADGSYKVSFGEAEFVAFFKEFLRPALVEMLF